MLAPVGLVFPESTEKPLTTGSAVPQAHSPAHSCCTFANAYLTDTCRELGVQRKDIVSDTVESKSGDHSLDKNHDKIGFGSKGEPTGHSGKAV